MATRYMGKMTSSLAASALFYFNGPAAASKWILNMTINTAVQQQEEETVKTMQFPGNWNQ